MRIRTLLGFFLMLAACTRAVDTNDATSETNETLVSARLTDPNGAEIASLVWERSTGDASWFVNDQRGSVHLDHVDRESAVTALRELVRLRSQAPTAPRNGYVTCGDANYCEGFSLEGGSCFACIEVRGDCSSVLTWSCTFQSQ